MDKGLVGRGVLNVQFYGWSDIYCQSNSCSMCLNVNVFQSRIPFVLTIESDTCYQRNTF
jgi:hypothetical protein